MTDHTEIMEKLVAMEERLRRIETGSDKMVRHVDLVETVWAETRSGVERVIGFLTRFVGLIDSVSPPVYIENEIKSVD
jgi:tetrahydromethanopterin S-methyltransferase subunit B